MKKEEYRRALLQAAARGDREEGNERAAPRREKRNRCRRMTWLGRVKGEATLPIDRFAKSGERGAGAEPRLMPPGYIRTTDVLISPTGEHATYFPASRAAATPFRGNWKNNSFTCHACITEEGCDEKRCV